MTNINQYCVFIPEHKLKVLSEKQIGLLIFKNWYLDSNQIKFINCIIIKEFSLFIITFFKIIIE